MKMAFCKLTKASFLHHKMRNSLEKPDVIKKHLTLPLTDNKHGRAEFFEK
jgi:hypothetical protein